MQEQVKLNLSARLGGDLGIYVYTSASGSAGILIPRISWTFGSGYMTQLAFQLGDKFLTTVSCTKNIGNMGITVNAAIGNSNITPSVSISRALSPSTTCRVDLGGGEQQSCDFHIEKKYSKRSKVEVDIGITEEKCDVSIGFAYKLTEMVKMKAREMIILKDFNGEMSVMSKPEFGISMKFKNNLTAGYFCETGPSDLKFLVKLKKNGFIIKVPISISKIISLKTIGICCGLVLSSCFLTYYLHKLVTYNPHALHKSKKFIIAEKKQDHIDYIVSIQDRAIEIRNEEINSNGLIILKSLYGNVGIPEENPEVIDVTLVIQVLVENSKLFLPAQSKEEISGFFNPCDKKSPMLYIKYKFAGVLKEVTFQDTQPVLLP